MLDEAEMADIARRVAAELADYRVGTGVSPR
jgi:hypothetical protein